MRILAVVYACEPDRGSEPGVGWRLVHELALEHEVVAVTRANNRPVIEKAQAEGGLPEVEFLYCDAPPGLRMFKRGNRGVYRYQWVWQILAFWKALRLHRQRPFELVHGITFSAAWFPSLFALFPAPFLWGPLACNQPVPGVLASELLTFGDRVRNGLRRLLNGPLSSLNPLVQFGRCRARRLLAVNPYVAACLGRAHRNKVVLYPAVGAAAVEGKDPANDATAGTTPSKNVGPNEELVSPSSRGRIDVAIVGRMIGLKGFPLALQALADTRIAGRVQLQCIGDGPLRAELEGQAQRLSISNSVRFHGELSHEETLAAIGEADALLFPGFDAGGMVMIEAMARSVPVIALDTGGAAVALRDGAGILVPVAGFDKVVEGIAAALSELIDDPRLCKRIGDRGRQRFEQDYEWERKGARLREIVREIEAESVQEAISTS